MTSYIFLDGFVHILALPAGGDGDGEVGNWIAGGEFAPETQM